MLVQFAIAKLLADNAGVSALAGGRIYPGVLPQTVSEPAVVIRVTGYRGSERLAERGSAGLALYEFRIGFVAKGTSAYLTAARMEEAGRLGLSGYHGTVADVTASPATAVRIKGIRKVSMRDFYDDPTRTHWVVAEYEVWASEPMPEPIDS